MNATKVPANDWIWYLDVYQSFTVAPYGEVMDMGFGLVRLKQTEPVFYVIAWSLAHLTNANPAVLAVAVSLLVYIPIGVVSGLIASRITNNGVARVVAILTAQMVGVTLTLTTQLVRQEIALTFLVVGGWAMIRQRRKASILCFVLAVLSHNSVIVAVGLLAGARYLAGRRSPEFWVRSAIVLAVGAILGIYYIIFEARGSYFAESDGAVSPLIQAADLGLVILAVALLRTRVSGLHRTSRDTLVFFTLGFYAFVASLYTLPIPFLRMYFYLDSVRIVALSVIFAVLCSDRKWSFAAPTSLLFAWVYLEARLQSSPFTYGYEFFANFLFATPLSLLS